MASRRQVPDRDNREVEAGQGLVEFALTVPVVVAIALLIVEMAFAGFAWANTVFSVREGARAGAVYLFQEACSWAENDSLRETGTSTCVGHSYSDSIRETVIRSMGILRDPIITWSYNPSGTPPHPVTRAEQKLTVSVTYQHQWLSGFFGVPPINLVGSATQTVEP